MNGCQTCGGFGMHHDPIAHGEESHGCRGWEWGLCVGIGCAECNAPTWVTCQTCKGEQTIRDRFGLDVDCPDCDGDGGREP